MVEYEECHCCFGKGYLDGEAYEDCPYCDGLGYIDLSEDNYDEDYDYSDRGEGWWQ
jgi:DnaJ-class molecular chaperone